MWTAWGGSSRRRRAQARWSSGSPWRQAFRSTSWPRGPSPVDGISLTVNSCEGDRVYVNIIPHTAEKTTLIGKKAGDTVNIETDILGKYVEKLLNPGKGVNMDFLREHGFLK